ncbi:helix-turn-helix domain-containing protein [Streptomyces sp. NPDC023998]|uniref:helix-turn-helix domain-containing protein n=1 Tax=Streptomyces sp. NPDC023998 TaxID=3154597 RepID=UPI0033F372E3
MQTKVLRAFRSTLDPSPAQVVAFSRHAGAARWAFNHALSMKVAAHQQWRRAVQQLVDQRMAEGDARKRVRMPVPTKPSIQKHLNLNKGDSRVGRLGEGVHGWRGRVRGGMKSERMGERAGCPASLSSSAEPHDSAQCAGCAADHG